MGFIIHQILVVLNMGKGINDLIMSFYSIYLVSNAFFSKKSFWFEDANVIFNMFSMHCYYLIIVLIN